VAIGATLTGSVSSIWYEGPTGLALAARKGQSAPSTSSPFESFERVVWNNLGQLALSAKLDPPIFVGMDDKGIWAVRGSGLAIVARAGRQAPGTPTGTNFAYSFFGGSDLQPQLNNAGQIAFTSRLSSSLGDNGIWADSPGGLALVVRNGNQAPGTPPGVTFNFFLGLGFNDAGQSAFSASLLGNGVDSTNNFGVWSAGSGSLSLLARMGDHAPGMPDDVVFATIGGPLLNNVGQTAFSAAVTGPGIIESQNDLGIWSEGLGSLALVARTGAHAPSTPDGVTFRSFNTFALNSAGQVALTGFLTGADVNNANNFGIWATAATGDLQLIARTGDLLELAPGDSRTISELAFAGATGNGDGRASGFNNAGHVAFRATFTDGSSGIFVSNAVAVPEPSTFLLLLLSAACASPLRRRW
jgi:hypothetical protein